VDTVSSPCSQHQKEPDHRSSVTNRALSVAAASGGGIAAILSATAFGAVPTGLAYLAVSIFGVIVLGSLIVAAICITRR
jgi:hypothetical protein